MWSSNNSQLLNTGLDLAFLQFFGLWEQPAQQQQ